MTKITEYTQTEAALAELRQSYKGVVFDVSTTKGMAAAKEARAVVRDYRVALEKMRKEIKAPALERCQLIDSEAKRITAALSELEDPIDAQIKAEEDRKEREKQARIEAERKRVEAIHERIGKFRDAILSINRLGASSTRIAEHIASVDAIAVDHSFAEFRELAETVKADTLAELREAHAAQIAREAEQERMRKEREELDRQRAEQAKADAAAAAERKRLEDEAAAERKRLADEARTKAVEEARAIREKAEADAAERLRIEQADRAKREAQERSEREARAKAEAEERAKREAAEQAERERIEAEKRAIAEARAEQARRELAERIASATIYTAAQDALILMNQCGLKDEPETIVLANVLFNWKQAQDTNAAEAA